jgi:hypothetical protein
VRSRTWRGSRRCCGSEESDNGTWVRVGCSVAVVIHLRSPLGSGRETMKRWNGERERGRECGVDLIFTVNTRVRRRGTGGHGRHAVAHPWTGQPCCPMEAFEHDWIGAGVTDW